MIKDVLKYLLDKLFDNLFLPTFIIPFLSSVGIGIKSKITTGSWVKIFEDISIYAWVVFIILIFLWIIAIFVLRRWRMLQESEGLLGPLIISTPIYGYFKISELPYAGILWDIIAPSPPPWKQLDNMDISVSDIEIKTPPKCPKCKTEIEEYRSFWGGHIWKCVRCKFKKRNKDSIYRESERAEKIARREFEIFKEGELKKS